ncbi:MAG: helix-turn-helix transcriptional regulator [Bacteroidetes bacterium]|nr:helix-turn-helix transcriptional regulator [Bacteroidota bacterium]
MHKIARNALGIIILEKETPIGLHIRKKRLELQMNQEDVAKKLGVTESCIWLWENLEAKPQIHYMPKIIAFLGYCPVEFDMSSIGNRIKSYRYVNGLSCDSLGLLLGVKGGAVSYWENGGIPKPKTLTKIQSLIG